MGSNVGLDVGGFVGGFVAGRIDGMEVAGFGGTGSEGNRVGAGDISTTGLFGGFVAPLLLSFAFSEKI